jgi:hypothetical protein
MTRPVGMVRTSNEIPSHIVAFWNRGASMGAGTCNGTMANFMLKNNMRLKSNADMSGSLRLEHD